MSAQAIRSNRASAKGARVRATTGTRVRVPESAAERDPRRAVPSLDALLRSLPGRKAISKFGRSLVKAALSATLNEVRAEAARGHDVPPDSGILAETLQRVAREYYGISEVLNATGVVLHTGLGRAPLPASAVRAVTEAARGYSDLEVDRETGGRGRRTSRAEAMLVALTGAQDSLVVNNNAAALLLALAGLAGGKEVLVSRGELIEIGGEFRLPDIMSASTAKLVEVGTTNRTRLSDYQRALSRKTGLILKVHPSNYRVTGFTKNAGLRELAQLAGVAKVPLMYDVGSGLLDRYPEIPADEPAVTEALAAGADLVAFSGDKLLGGPQAGILAGRADLIDRLRRHPLARALRVDKMTVAAMEAVLRLYATERRAELPVWASLSAPRVAIEKRARALSLAFRGSSVRDEEAAPGGGSLPGYAIPSAQLVVPATAPEEVATRLRLGRPPVFCRVDAGALVFDLRTVPAENDDRLIRAIRYALQQG
jgi:L-seryl-tRNA(Ser) seleniumtransferase